MNSAARDCLFHSAGKSHDGAHGGRRDAPPTSSTPQGPVKGVEVALRMETSTSWVVFFFFFCCCCFFPSHSAPPTNAAVKFRSTQSVGSPREKRDLDNPEFKEVFSVQQLHGAEDVLMAPECNALGVWVFFSFFSTSTGNAPLTCEPPAAREQEKEVQLPLTHGCLDIDLMYRSWQRCPL